MERLVVLVDAGYLFSQSVKVLSAKASRSRSDLTLNDAAGLIGMLVQKASTELANNKLLRVYWYDGIKNGLSPEHRAIVDVDDVQLRQGTINGQGQQKGVDSKIVIDLIELASNQAISDAMIVTGDGDLAIGIELSQRRGIRVAVLGVEDLSVGVHHAQSTEVTNVADRVIRIGASDLLPYLSYVAKTSPQQSTQPTTSPSASVTPSANPQTSTSALPSSTPTQANIEQAVKNFIAAQIPALQSSVISSTGSIEPSVDKALLYHVYTELGQGALSGADKRSTRAALRKLLKTTP